MLCNLIAVFVFYVTMRIDPAKAIFCIPFYEVLQQEDSSEINISDEELEVLARCCLGEAEGESELGKRLVIDTVLNRIDSPKFPNDICSVVYQENQYSGMGEARQNRVTVTDDILELCKEEIVNRTDSEVLYFRTKHYHRFGTPLFREGNHYFSKD